MTRSFVALLLLVAFGCGLLAGPHPCHAASVASPPAAGEASGCHARESAAAPDGEQQLSALQESDCCGEDGALCESLCQGWGVVRVESPEPALEPWSRMAVPVADRSLPLFAPPIDHIPLA